MDDETFHTHTKTKKRSYFLSTQGYEKVQIELLSRCLETKFNIHTKIHKDQKYWRLYIKAQSHEIFLSLINKYLHFSMRYKISLNRLEES